MYEQIYNLTSMFFKALKEIWCMNFLFQSSMENEA